MLCYVLNPGRKQLTLLKFIAIYVQIAIAVPR